MVDTPVRTDKSFQLKVMGALALAALVIFGIVLSQLEANTIRTAAIVVLAGMLIAIGILSIEL